MYAYCKTDNSYISALFLYTIAVHMRTNMGTGGGGVTLSERETWHPCTNPLEALEH